MVIVEAGVARSEATRSGTGSFVDWGAIFAGVVISLAISSVFISFGSAVGLSAASFQTSSVLPVMGLVLAAGLWFLWVQISSFLGGAYVTGRLSRRVSGVASHEVEMRDGLHGLIVWGVNLAIAAALAAWVAMSGVGAAVNGTGPDAMRYQVDRLVRSDAVQPVANAAADDMTKGEMGRVLAKSVAMKTADTEDRAFLTREISSRTGLPQADAEKRLGDTISTLQVQADRARKYSVLLAFLTAASFLVSAVAAWWGGVTGGKHRDDEVDHSRHTRWK